MFLTARAVLTISLLSLPGAVLAQAGPSEAQIIAGAPTAKINVGALGNIVRQMHVHVIARFETDAAWPGPVWGQGARLPYEPAARARLCGELLERFTRNRPHKDGSAG